MFKITLTPHQKMRDDERYVVEGENLIAAVKAFIAHLETLEQEQAEWILVDALEALHHLTSDVVRTMRVAATYRHYEMDQEGFDLSIEEVK